MKIAVISDIHGNRIALQLCLSVANSFNCDNIVCLGDIVGYYPDVLSCMQIINDNKIHYLMGNHEAMLLGLLHVPEQNEDIYKLGDAKELLSQKDLNRLASSVPFFYRSINEQRILFVHGSPWNPLNGYIYPDMNTNNISYLEYDVIFCGHTHRPFIRLENQTLLINVGSCGLPRDNGSLCSFAIYDTLSGEAEIIRVPMNIEIIKKEYPKIHLKVRECLEREETAVGTIVNERG
jgi:putative phosphoesterase